MKKGKVAFHHETFMPWYHADVIGDMLLDADDGFHMGNPRLSGRWEESWPLLFDILMTFIMDEALLDLTGNLDAPL